MAQLVMGRLLPNLNISVDNEKSADIEEGELSDNEDISEISVVDKPDKKNVDIVRNWMQTLHTPKIYENKNGGFITGLDLSSEVLVKKLEERAERFGLQNREERPITQKEIDALYKSLEIDPANLSSCKLKNIRLDALHMRGVDEMSTNEIFKYFGEYGPASVEWINDSSCNVVWLDEATTARALLGKSQPLVIKKKVSERQDSLDSLSTSGNKREEEAVIEMSDSDESDDEDSRRARNIKSESAMEVDTVDGDVKSNEVSVEHSSVDIPIPPGHWRLGEPHTKAKAILFRFATKDDKKIRGAEKRSQYYQKYGNPNYGGMVGLISQSRKRKMQAAKNKIAVGQFLENHEITEQVPVDTSSRPMAKVNRNKSPRMKMYADEEEKKSSGHEPRINRPKPGSIHSRLGTKYTKEDLYHLGNEFASESEEEEDGIEINCTVPSRFNVWTDIAKSMAKEDRKEIRTKQQNDFGKDLSRYKLTEHLRTLGPSHRRDRERFDEGDLRSTLGPRSRTRDYSSRKSHEDLRSKIKRLKGEESDTRKHRSPLCKDD